MVRESQFQKFRLLTNYSKLFAQGLEGSLKKGLVIKAIEIGLVEEGMDVHIRTDKKKILRQNQRKSLSKN